MPKIDDALMQRLGAYVDGESCAKETAAIEELIARRADVRREVEELEAAGRAIRSEFLSHVESQPIDQHWHRLLEPKPGPTRERRWLASWPIAASLVALSISLLLSSVGYMTLTRVTELEARLAESSEQSASTIEQLSRTLANTFGNPDVRAADNSQPPIQWPQSIHNNTEIEGSLQRRLAMAIAELREANDVADRSKELLSQANQQMAHLRAELARVSDPLQQIVAYHQLFLDAGLPAADMVVAAIEARLRATLGPRLQTPDLGKFGFSLRGGDLLLISNQAVACLRYADKDEALLSLWITHPHGLLVEQTRQRYGALDLIAWQVNEYNYVVVGSQTIMSLAKIVEAIGG